MKNIPNIITSFNLAAGFLAIILAAQGNLAGASWIIIAAMVLDFLDGFAARLLKAHSDFGRELDSLSDMVSFGAAPALIMYRLIEGATNADPAGAASGQGILPSVLVLSTVIMPVCAALRLAKFNIDPAQKKSFLGLPTPANALAVVSLVLSAHYSQSSLAGSLIAIPELLVLFTIILSFLMVARIPMLSLKISGFGFKGNEGRYILVILVIASFAVFGMSSFLLIVPLYIIVSLISRFF